MRGGENIKLNWKKSNNFPSKSSPKFVDELVKIKGINNFFLFQSPTKSVLNNPQLLFNMELLTDRILEQCIKQQKKTYVFSDVDPDGITSTAIMYNYLKPLNENVEYFYSQRSDGHGIQQALDLVPSDCELLIIVDSSSNDVEACKQLSERGIEILIIDHHEVEQDNAYCTLVNPKQSQCSYPNKQSSGSLLCWKVCQVLDEKLGLDRAKSMIDLAGLGLYSDMQDMSVLENRYVVNQMFGNIKNIGYKALLKTLDKDKVKLSTTVIGFDITPCINAATRLDSIEIPLELFTTQDEKRAIQLAERLKDTNKLRKEQQKEISNRLKESINTYVSDNDKCLFIIDSSIGKGYNGLVANSLASHYNRPVFLLNEKDGVLSGSYRSKGVNLYKLLFDVRSINGHGGHDYAGGVSLNSDKLDQFKQEMNQLLSDYQVDDSLYYDIEIESEHIDDKNIKQYEDMFNISGTGYEKSNVLVKNLVVTKFEKLKDGTTYKLGCVSEFEYALGEKFPTLICMKFGGDTEFENSVKEGDKIHVIGTLNLNIWARYKPKYEVTKTKQILIEDLCVVK